MTGPRPEPSVEGHAPRLFPGSVHLGPGLPAWAELLIAAPRLRARTRDGVSHTLAFDDMEVDSGGHDGDIVFCRSRTGSLTLSTSDPGFLPALAEAGGPALVQAAADKMKTRRTLRRVGIALTAFVLLLVAFVVVQVPTMLAHAATELPLSIDRELGDTAYASMEVGPVVRRPRTERFLAEVVGRLAPHAAEPGLEYRIDVVDSELVNAFALPGGQIVVYTGLLAKADDPGQVAGVIAHEMSHVTLRHGLRNVAHSASTRLAIGLLLGDAEGWLALAGSLASSAQENAYSRDQENEADLEGARMMAAAGLDPAGLVRFFELLEAEAGSELAGMANWFSTHPEHRERIENVMRVGRAAGGTYRPLATDWAAVKGEL